MIYETYNTMSQIFKNGKLIDSRAVHGEYDGEKMNIKVIDNCNEEYVHLTKENLLELMELKSDSLSLTDRLKKDFTNKHYKMVKAKKSESKQSKKISKKKSKRNNKKKSKRNNSKTKKLKK
uniref:Uncharacterized protein n=1 Tax=viral metagenome TaxID=1070528 RepID=A0A6C0KED8_9ZZZZ